MSATDPTADTLRHWSAVASAWDKYRNRLFEDVRSVSEWIVEQVDPQPGQTVLELTAGPGETGFLAAGRLGSTGRLISSDFVPAMVEAARRGADERGFDNVECRVLDAQQIDLPDSSVEGVVAGPVAELVSSLDGDQVTAIRSNLESSLAAFERDGALEIPWLATVTSVA